ncbi:MAG: hypothetical protein ACK553_19080 [Planctomycetota bacterium]
MKSFPNKIHLCFPPQIATVKDFVGPPLHSSEIESDLEQAVEIECNVIFSDYTKGFRKLDRFENNMLQFCGVIGESSGKCIGIG